MTACADRELRGERLVEAGGSPFVALTVLPNGGLAYGELLTGVVWTLDAPLARDAGDEPSRPREVIRLDVASTGQRGVLGLAVVGDGLFASWVRPDDLRLMVGQIDVTPPRLVWEGPITAETANGGSLVAMPNGGLLIGIGDLRAPDQVPLPDTPNGKLLVLDPDGSPDQVPRVRSGGWNNPFALAPAPNGEVWVADNHPLDTPERLAVDGFVDDATVLPKGTAPAAVATDGNQIWVCGNKSGQILAYRLSADRRSTSGGSDTLGPRCRTGLALLPDGRLVWADDEGLVVSEEPVSGGG